MRKTRPAYHLDPGADVTDDLTQRPRRNRRSAMIRRAVHETELRPQDLIFTDAAIDVARTL